MLPSGLRSPSALALTFTLTVLGLTSPAFGQGPLTPPGAPAVTMKTLSQLEPRTPISSAPFTISSPGSYYLTGNLATSSDGVIIAADDVSLDLNGYTISSTASSVTGNGVTFSGPRARISISNGHIRSSVGVSGDTFSGTGFDGGINWPSSAPTAVHVSRVTVTGVRTYGIDVGLDASSLVESCIVRVAESIGIRAGVVASSNVSSIGTANGTAVIAGRVFGTTGTNTSGANSITAASQGGDARIALSGAGTISAPGSYYLTQNITVTSGDAITITASNVTLDLNGFSIISTASPAAGTGINCPSVRTGIVIRNGAIRGSVTRVAQTYSGAGFQNGIAAASSVGVQVENVQVTGLLVAGMLLPTSSSSARNCLVTTCGGTGLQAEVVDGCSVTDIGGRAIIANVATRSVAENVTGTFDALTATTANDCRATSLAGTGVKASTVMNCIGTSTSGSGIDGGASVLGSQGVGGGPADGIRCLDGVVTNSYGQIIAGGTGVGLRALTANGSRGVNASNAISQAITNKFNMP